jgi:branched-chain amino acid transport system permease protein
VVGGLGTFRGTVLSALLLGFVMTFARVWVPEFSNFVSLATMAAILLIRPSGLVSLNVRQV